MADYGRTNDYWPTRYWVSTYYYWPITVASDIFSVILEALNVNSITLDSISINLTILNAELIGNPLAIANPASYVLLQANKVNQIYLNEELKV